MVKYGKIPGRPAPKPVEYDPYALVNLVVNGKKCHGRPYQFNTERVDHNTLLDKDGKYIWPTRCTAMCPECCGMLDIELTEPVLGEFALDCRSVTKCGIHKSIIEATAPDTDPFINPFSNRLMVLDGIDVDLVNALSTPVIDRNITVAERITKNTGLVNVIDVKENS